MKNPLIKRLPRELRGDLGKYAVIFLFLVATIGFVSGFLVADRSMQIAYDESFERYAIEDGHFTLAAEANPFLLSVVKSAGIHVYPLFYKEEKEGESTFRIYANRTEINLASVLEGELAQEDDGIAIDRLFAENNGIQRGDTLTIAGKAFTVCGLAAFSDYSALFRSNTDMMFDAQNFTVAAVTEEAFRALPDTHLQYTYAWKYADEGLSEEEKNDRGEKLMKGLAFAASLTDFVKEEDNQAIHFTGDDMGSDEAMMIWLLYIVIVIMAFVFAVTTSNTIEHEAAVIGTLRASGYTKGELLRHYLTLPLAVMLIGAVVGNILGYTVFKEIVADMYYGSYSLPAYETVWSGYAFVMTTVIPCVLMLLVNLLILWRKLSLSPLKFLRRDLRKSRGRRAVRLPQWRFMTRFSARVILQNLPGYGILAVGVLFSTVLLLFGLMMTPLLTHYKTEVVENMICDYQYMLKAPVETAQEGAEKFAVTVLNLDGQQDEITVYGIEENSAYFPLETENGDDEVIVSEGILEKYGMAEGDELKLTEKYGGDTFSFSIGGSCVYPGALTVFMDMETFREVFSWKEGQFSGYFSNVELEDIGEEDIASVITEADMTILADQLFDSMGSMFPMISAFAVLLNLLLVYLLSKVILEKNAVSLSMVKILGYQNGEIARLYLVSTAAVVFASLVVSLPLSYGIIRLIYGEIISSFSGWLSLYIAPEIYAEMLAFGILAYAVVGAIQFRKIRSVPMEEALKNAE